MIHTAVIKVADNRMRCLWLAFILICWVDSAAASQRVALIIGNGAYQNVPRLANPGNDSVDMAAKLSGLGFDVVQA